MSAYREFTGKSVEEALKGAREEFGVELNDLDFEILTPGSRGVLGMGAEPARIVAAPRSALGGAAPKREAAATTPLPASPPREDRGFGGRTGSDDRGPRRDDRGGGDRGGFRGGDRARGHRLARSHRVALHRRVLSGGWFATGRVVTPGCVWAWAVGARAAIPATRTVVATRATIAIAATEPAPVSAAAVIATWATIAGTGPKPAPVVAPWAAVVGAGAAAEAAVLARRRSREGRRCRRLALGCRAAER